MKRRRDDQARQLEPCVQRSWGMRNDAKPEGTSQKQANFYGGRTGFAEVKPSLCSLKFHFRAPEAPEDPRNPGRPTLQLIRKFTHF